MEKREALTVRFPGDVLEGARQCKAERESLNDFVVEAVEHEIQRRQGLETYREILRVRETIESQTGLQPDSTLLIRSLREGTVRGD